MVRILTEGWQCHHKTAVLGRSRVGAVHPISCALLGAWFLSLLVHPFWWLLHGPGRIVNRGFQVLQRSCKKQVDVPSWSWVHLDSVTPLGNYENYRLGHFCLNSPFLRMLLCSLEGLFPQHRCQATSMENLKNQRNLWEVKNNIKFFQSIIQNASVALCLDSSPSNIEKG